MNQGTGERMRSVFERRMDIDEGHEGRGSRLAQSGELAVADGNRLANPNFELPRVSSGGDHAIPMNGDTGPSHSRTLDFFSNRPRYNLVAQRTEVVRSIHKEWLSDLIK